MTTVRSADPPYSYNNRESRRAARQRASMYSQLIDEADRNTVLASSWPGGWQSRIKANSHKACCCLSSTLRYITLHIMLLHYIMFD